MAELLGVFVEFVVKVGLFFAYLNEPLLAFWHALEVLCALIRLTGRVWTIWWNRWRGWPEASRPHVSGPGRTDLVSPEGMGPRADSAGLGAQPGCRSD